MPFKVCPKCSAQHGARRLVCTCGHDFGCKRSGKYAVAAFVESVEPVEPGKKRRRRRKQNEFPYPEPGTWIWDRPKGMLPICPPFSLPTGPFSVGVIKEQVSYEGLGFCLYSFIRADRIADPKLREMWVKTRAMMQEIVMYLEQVPWEGGEEETWDGEDEEFEDVLDAQEFES